MSSSGFEHRPYGKAVNVTNNYMEWKGPSPPAKEDGQFLSLWVRSRSVKHHPLKGTPAEKGDGNLPSTFGIRNESILCLGAKECSSAMSAVS
ncbi:hypothetical protein TNCV_117261 [Trichonephila clavipes]|nr:hypothetical protein TNCV_117261 [Trichonephila clavipes]